MLTSTVRGLLSSTRGVVEVDSSGKVTLEIRKPKNVSYTDTLELFRRVQVEFGGVGRIYEDIETVAGRGLFVANDADAIVIMRKVLHGNCDYMLTMQMRMKRIVEWWNAGKPLGAPLKALMKDVNYPLKPAVLQSRLDGDESCASCKAKNGGGTTLRLCAGCCIPVYCSTECQKKDWISHKPVCKATRELAKINLM